ncbi:hypothetical protein [Streptomyces monashensis]|nr:hypothetical protein [Streptomyces monashensis]
MLREPPPAPPARAAGQETWASAHARHAAQPAPDRPDGAIIATSAFERWVGEPVRVRDLTP